MALFEFGHPLLRLRADLLTSIPHPQVGDLRRSVGPPESPVGQLLLRVGVTGSGWAKPTA